MLSLIMERVDLEVVAPEADILVVELQQPMDLQTLVGVEEEAGRIVALNMRQGMEDLVLS